MMFAQHDVDRFKRDGFSEPFRVLDADDATQFRGALDRALERDGLDPRSRLQSRHLDVPEIAQLCEHPVIIERVRAVLGSAIVLWRSNLFTKEPGAPLFDWHRDREPWGTLLDPMLNVTAWLALEPATRANGCIEVRGHTAGPHETRAIELDAGECFLFDHDLLHRSGPNPTAHRRLGLAIRFTQPGVRIDRTRLFAGYRPILLQA